MKNKEVCEAFLEGVEANTKHLFVEHNVIYSYGYHFPLAVKLEDGHIIINSYGYSNTTARHKGDLCRCLGFDNFKDLCENRDKSQISIRTTLEIKEIISKNIKSFVELISEEI